MRWCVLLALFVVFCFTPQTFGKDRKTYAMSMKIFQQMEAANLLVEQDQYAEALEELTKLVESKRTSKYEKAQIYSLIGSIQYRNSDQNSALLSFTKVLDFAGGIPILLHTQTLKTLSQLHMINEEYLQSRKYCQELVNIAEEPDYMNYALLAQANFKLEDWNAARDAAIIARQLSLDKQDKPDENILLLLNAVYFEQKQIDKMPEVLEEIIKYYPKTSYILYLASVYGQLDRLDKQAVLMEALYDDGKLKDASQLRNLASLYMSERTPYKGAMVLQEALATGKLETTERNLHMLSQAWRLSAEREKAISVLTEAAKMSQDGNHYLQAAYMMFDMAKWKKAEQALMEAFDKGMNDKHNGEAWLLLGMTRFKLSQFDKAIEACEKASKFKNSAKHAKQWITYIANEKLKYESMQPTSS